MSRPLVSMLAIALLALAACAAPGDEDLGRAELALTGRSPSGTVYRLRNAELTVRGPGLTQVFHTEDEPSRTTITTRLAPAAYAVELAAGWSLERIEDDGSATAVAATLQSSNPLGFNVVSGERTSVVLEFLAGTDLVAMADGEADISIRVNDPTARALVVDSTFQTITEGGSEDVMVSLSFQPPSPITVVASSSNRSVAFPGVTTLTFDASNWNIPVRVPVHGVHDANLVQDEARLIFSAPAAPTVEVPVVVDDIDVQSIVANSTSLTMPAGSSTMLTARLAFQPPGPVTVTVSSDNPGALAVSPASLSFAPGNFDGALTIRLTAAENLADQTVHVVLRAIGISPTVVAVDIRNVALP